MLTDGLVSVSCQHGLEIDGTTISLYEYGEPPTGEFGYVNMDVLLRQAFPTDNLPKNVFYEAYRSGSKKPFYASETPPTTEELLFKLRESERVGLKTVAILLGVGLVALITRFSNYRVYRKGGLLRRILAWDGRHALG